MSTPKKQFWNKMSSFLFSHNIEFTNQVRFQWVQSQDKYEKPMTKEEKSTKYSTNVNDCQCEFSILDRIPDTKFSPSSLANKLAWSLNRWYRDTALFYAKLLSLPNLQNSEQFQEQPWLRLENDRYFIECIVQSFSVTVKEHPRFHLRRFSLDEILFYEQLMDLMTDDFRKIIFFEQECIYVHRRIEEYESCYKIQALIKHLNDSLHTLVLDKIPLTNKIKIEPQSPVQIDEDFAMQFEDDVIKVKLTEKEYLREENARLLQKIEELQKDNFSKDEKAKMMTEAWQYEQNQHSIYSNLAASITQNYLQLKREMGKEQKAIEDIKKLAT